MLDLPRPSGTAAWAGGQGQEARPSRPSLSPGVPPAPDTGIPDPLQGHPHNPEQGKDASETEVRASGKGVCSGRRVLFGNGRLSLQHEK